MEGLFEVLLNGLTWEFFVGAFIIANITYIITLRKPVKKGIATNPKSPEKFSLWYFFCDNGFDVIQVECAIIIGILFSNIIGSIPGIEVVSGGSTLAGGVVIGYSARKIVRWLQSKDSE